MKLILRLLVLSVPAATLMACGGKQPVSSDKAAVPPPLAGSVVHAQQAPREQVWDGVVEAVNQVTITAQTNARVLELPHDVNDVVAKGDVLVRFSDIEQKSARNAAQAQIASAQASYKDAQASYERIAAVYAKGYVSTAQMDQQRAARDAAKAALESARAQLGSVGQQLDYTVLRAPFAGIITRRFVHVGEAVQAGPPSPQPLIQLQALDHLRVNVQVPQSGVDAIRTFHTADVLPAGEHDRRITATGGGGLSVCRSRDPHLQRAIALARRRHRSISRHDGKGGVRHGRGKAPAGTRLDAGSARRTGGRVCTRRAHGHLAPGAYG